MGGPVRSLGRNQLILIYWISFSFATAPPPGCLLAQNVADGGVGGHELEDGVAEEASNGASHSSLRSTR